jgi:hypothetical protein
MNVESDSSLERLHSTTLYRTGLLVLMTLATAMSYASLVINGRQEAMLDELLKRSGSMQETSVLMNPETRSRVGSCPNGSGR